MRLTKVKGKKFDSEKPDWSLVNMKQLEGLADVLTYGAKKYDRHNWVNVEPYRYFAALQRHIAAWQDGEENDVESGLNHLHHAMANLYFLLEHSRLGNRYKFQGE